MSEPESFLIKEEILSEDEEVYCRLCQKGFVSMIALNNHVRMEHMEAYENGDPTVWTKVQEDVIPSSLKKKTKTSSYARTKDILSSMSPTSLASLAGSDVSYIIVKEDPLTSPSKRIIRKDVIRRVTINKKPKAVQAITGPFECLEPSPLGADGVCHQIFFSCCEYSLHSRHEHSRRRRAPRCQVCERTLPARRIEPGETVAYACESCGAHFETGEELESHTKTDHVKVKPYACGICHKRFTQQGGVLQHMRMHTGERPFPCTLCNKAFTQKSGLDQHMRTHTKHKPYRCVVCSKTFVQSVHLKQHMRTHTNVAPFQCGICDKRFKQSSHLNYHLKNYDPATMTDEQRAKYELLIGQITHNANMQDDDEIYTGGEVEVELQESGQDTYVIQSEEVIGL